MNIKDCKLYLRNLTHGTTVEREKSHNKNEGSKRYQLSMEEGTYIKRALIRTYLYQSISLLMKPWLHNTTSFLFCATINWSFRGFNFRKDVSKELIVQETSMSVSIQTYRNWVTRYGNWSAIVIKSPNPGSKEICSHKSCNSSQSMYSSTSRKILKLYGLICVNFMKTLWNCSVEKSTILAHYSPN